MSSRFPSALSRRRFLAGSAAFAGLLHALAVLGLSVVALVKYLRGPA